MINYFRDSPSMSCGLQSNHRDFISLKVENWFQKYRMLYNHPKRLVWGILVLLFLLAFIVRVRHIDHSRHVAEVQFRSALIARSFYFRLTDSIPEWRKQANDNSIRNLNTKEPPITELLVAIGYKLLGEENLRFPRLLTSLYWLVGSVFLYNIARDWVSGQGAIIAAAYYLFIPLGVILSISFQPDSLMIMLFIISLYAILNYYKKTNWNMLARAAILSGIAILVKPLIVFAITSAFLGPALYRGSGLRQFLDKKMIVFLAISYLPGVLYYGYGIFFTGDLMQQVEWSFLPELLLTKAYWRDWMRTALNVVGLTPLLAGFLGIPLAQRGVFRAFLVGLWGGYILFGLVFAYHIRYAGYYHAQLIPIVALSFTSLASLLIRQIHQAMNVWHWSLFYIAAVFLLLFVNLRNVNELIWLSSEVENEEIAIEIGEIVHHSQSVVYVAAYYGRPLEYYAELTGGYWPRRISDHDLALGKNQSLSVEDRLANLGFTPEYFVITAMGEYERNHEDLKDYLSNHCRLVKSNKQFIIYNFCQQ